MHSKRILAFASHTSPSLSGVSARGYTSLHQAVMSQAESNKSIISVSIVECMFEFNVF